MIRPIDFLECAKKYVGQSETDNRTAASRAYYAVYHACKEIALNNGYDAYIQKAKPQCGDHKKLELFFEYKHQKEIADLLRTMKSIRHMADYALGEKFFKATAQKQIEKAEILLHKVEILKVKSF